MIKSKIKHFNKKASSLKSKPDEIIKVLNLKQNQKIADIGAGGGYFSIRFAKQIGPQGKVYAVDIEKQFLQQIKNLTEKSKIKNIETVLDNKLYETIDQNSLDWIFMRNVLHHINDRTDYLKNISKLLKPQGKIAAIDYSDKKKGWFNKFFGHSLSPENFFEEAEKANLKLEKEYKFLSEQFFFIFKPLF
ncbi:MAG: class I SAM-dependent methyltransferase [Elusimicrobiota bacterium]